MKIAIAGLAGSGKDTIARHLVKKYGAAQVSFSDPLKDAVSALFGLPRHLLQGDTPESRKFRETVDPFWSEKLKRQVTPRTLLQEFGTDLIREKYCQELFVHATLRKIEALEGPVCISDVRFQNELDALRRNGFIVFRVLRKNVKAQDHASENGIKDFGTCVTIENNGSVEQLTDQIDQVLVSLGLANFCTRSSGLAY